MPTPTKKLDDTRDMLRDAGLRPTRQRLALAELLFDGPDRHITAEDLYQQAQAAGISVSLATIYNALHDFTGAHLLREVAVDSTRSYFDTNTTEHHHFFLEDKGELIDIAQDSVKVTGLPETPEGQKVSRVDVIVRISS